MSTSSTNFKIYDPIEDALFAVNSGSGGSGGVPSTGGVFTGPVTMQSPSRFIQPALPTGPSDVANKAYVDNAIASGGGGVPSTGGTFTGPVSIQSPNRFSQAAAPTSPTDVVNKQYVDGTFLPLAGGTVSGPILYGGATPSSPNELVNKAYVDNAVAGGGGGVPSTGGTFTGPVSIQSPNRFSQPALPTGPNDVVNKQYVDSTFLPLAGGLMTGAISMGSSKIVGLGSPTLATDAANKAYVDSQITSNTPQNATTSTNGIIRLAGDLSGSAESPTIKPGVVSNSKMAPGSNKTLKGTDSTGAVADISLGPNLSISDVPASLLTVNISSLSNSFLPLVGGTMQGPINLSSNKVTNVPNPIDPNDAVNKSYVDNQLSSKVVDASTTVKGIVQLTNDFAGTADLPSIGPKKVTNAKLADMGAVSQLKGSSASTQEVVDISLGSGLRMVNSQLGIDPAVIPTIPVGVLRGGTGVTTLVAGYVKSNGTNPFTSVTAIPVADVTGAVRTVNGSLPDNAGNVSVALGDVSTGPLADLPTTASAEGDIYVVSGDPDPSKNGITYIWNGTSWLEITSNQASTDNRYLLKSAPTTFSGTVLTVAAGSKITLTDVATADTDAMNFKTFKDTKAGASQLGVVQFLTTGAGAGDLIQTANNSGVALVKPKAIGTTKMTIGGTSRIFGSNSTSNNVTELSLGTGFKYDNNTLNVDVAAAGIDPANATQIGGVTLDGEVQNGQSDLTFVNAGFPTIATKKVTNAKMADMDAIKQLKGSSADNVDVTNITLGTGLSMTESTLSVNSSALGKAGASQFGVIEFSSTGDLIPTAADSGIAVIRSGAVSNVKLAQTASNGQLKGSAAGSKTVADISLGTGLALNSSTLSVNTANLNKAGAEQFGVVEFDPAGDLISTAANSGIAVIRTGAITNPKIAPGGANTLKGTNSLNEVNDISLGSGLSLSPGQSPTLSVDVSALSKAGASQFGVVEFASTGDLEQTAADSGIAVIRSGAVSNGKLAETASNGQLKGSAAGSKTVADISLGTGLALSGSTLSVNTANLNKAGVNQFGVVAFGATGDLEQTAADSGLAVIKGGAISNSKMANMSGVSRLKGSNASVANVTDISLGSGLNMSNDGILSVSNVAVTNSLVSSSNKITSTVSGVASDITISQGSYTSLVGLNNGGTLVSTTIGNTPSTKLVGLDNANGLTSTGPADGTVSTILGYDVTSNLVKMSAASLTTSKASSETYGTIVLNSGNPDNSDLTGANGIALVANNKISYAKIQQETASSIMGIPSGVVGTANYQRLSLGSSMSLTGANGAPANGSVLNSAISVLPAGNNNPATTAPVDRPQNTSVAYVGGDGSIWRWTGSAYITTSANYTRAQGSVVLGGSTITVGNIIFGLSASGRLNLSTTGGNKLVVLVTYESEGFPAAGDVMTQSGGTSSGRLTLSTTPIFFNSRPHDDIGEGLNGKIYNITDNVHYDVTLFMTAVTVPNTAAMNIIMY
jgi:hypothetical protein